jgi:hypothetical protein
MLEIIKKYSIDFTAIPTLAIQWSIFDISII